jgi:hypothetical protein
VARAGAGGDGGAPAATAAPRDTKDARDAKDAKDAKDAAKDAKETRDPAVAPAQPGEVPSDATRTAAGAADAKPPEPSPAALLVALRAVGCVEFGPLREPDAVRLLVALDAVGAELAVSAGRADEVTAWMVFVAPRASELQTRLEALRERGVRDLYVLPEGSAWRGTVSLGLFRQEELALGLQRTIAARGVRNVRVAPRGPGAGPMTLRARPAAEPLLAELPRLRAAIPDAVARPCATARG